MDLFDVARACFRRWYVFLPLLLIVGWYSHTVYSSVKPVYYSSTVIGLAPASTRVDQAAPGAQVPRNGLLDIGGATLVANMASFGLRQPAVVDRVVAAGGLPDYNPYLLPSPGGGQLPLISIDEIDKDPDAVARTLELVIAQADVVLQNLQRQAGVPEDQMMKTFVVSPPRAPAAGMPTRTRSTIAIFAAGLGLAIMVAVLADVVLGRRRQRIESRRHTAPADGASSNRKPEDAPEIASLATTHEGALSER